MINKRIHGIYLICITTLIGVLILCAAPSIAAHNAVVILFETPSPIHTSLASTPLYVLPPTVTPDFTVTAQSITETALGTWYAELTAEATAVTRTPLQPMPTLPPPTAISVMTRWNPDGELIADLREGQLRIIDAQTGNVFHFSTLLPADITYIDWHSNGEQFAIGTDSGKVMIWTIGSRSGDLLTLSHVTILEFGSYLDHDFFERLIGVYSVEWSQDGTYLAAGGLMGVLDNLQIWDTRTYTQLLRANIGITVDVRWSPVKDTLAVIGSGNLYLFDADVLDKSKTLELTHENWEQTAHRLMQVTPEPGDFYSTAHDIATMSWDKTGERLALGDYDGNIWIMDVATGMASLFDDLQPPDTPSRYDVSGLIWDDDGRVLYGAISVYEVVEEYFMKISYTTRYVNILAWDTKNATIIARFRSNAYRTSIDRNLKNGQIVFGDIPTDPYSTNLIGSSAVHIVDTVNP